MRAVTAAVMAERGTALPTPHLARPAPRAPRAPRCSSLCILKVCKRPDQEVRGPNPPSEEGVPCGPLHGEFSLSGSSPALRPPPALREERASHHLPLEERLASALRALVATLASHRILRSRAWQDLPAKLGLHKRCVLQLAGPLPADTHDCHADYVSRVVLQDLVFFRVPDTQECEGSVVRKLTPRLPLAPCPPSLVTTSRNSLAYTYQRYRAVFSLQTRYMPPLFWAAFRDTPLPDTPSQCHLTARQSIS